MNIRLRWQIRTAALVAAAMVSAVSASRTAHAVDPLNPSPNCSPLDPGPCAPSYCGVFSGSPCVPYYLPPIGQDLHLTISSRDAGRPRAPDPDHPIATIGELFAALRACWEPPALPGDHHRMQMSLRFAFKRSGAIMAEPRITYVSKDVGEGDRRQYREAIDAALARCTPMPFSKTMAGAIAGRPIAVRFVDDRDR